jgi:phosphatidylglycerophosphatase A
MTFEIWQYPIHILAYGFGTGLMPFAPGTFGSLVGVALFWFMAPMRAVPYAGVVIIMFLAGIFICGQTASDVGAIDPGSIVYDEVVGFLVAMYLLPRDWRWIATGFVIYRIFDIWKPFPIHYLESHLGLGSGIMTDDVVAGLYTLMVLHLSRVLIRKFVAAR